MKQTATLLLLFIFTMTFLSCEREDRIERTVRFRLEYNGQPLVMYQDYIYPDGRKIQFTRFSFYLSDLNFRGDGKSEEVEDVDFINLTQSHADQASSIDGFTYKTEKLGLSGTDAISFNFGLTEQQNQSIPADHSSGDPLAKPGEYWVAWDSYIFVKIEGWIDLDNSGDAETGIALHLGSDDVMQEVDLPILSPGDEVEMVIDVQKIFQGSGIYDIDSNPQIHSLGQLDAARELAHNLQQSIRINNE